MKQVILLQSDDRCIDKHGNIYPLNCDGTPELMITCHVDEQDDEFWDTISDNDSARIYQVLEGRLNE